MLFDFVRSQTDNALRETIFTPSEKHTSLPLQSDSFIVDARKHLLCVRATGWLCSLSTFYLDSLWAHVHMNTEGGEKVHSKEVWQIFIFIGRCKSIETTGAMFSIDKSARDWGSIAPE